MVRQHAAFTPANKPLYGEGHWVKKRLNSSQSGSKTRDFLSSQPQPGNGSLSPVETAGLNDKAAFPHEIKDAFFYCQRRQKCIL
jgi:hypothetical protein